MRKEANLKQIFGSMINQKILDFENEVKSMGDTLTDATISFYHAAVAKFLPTPTRIHYLFNLRDISKVSIFTFSSKPSLPLLIFLC